MRLSSSIPDFGTFAFLREKVSILKRASSLLVVSIEADDGWVRKISMMTKHLEELVDYRAIARDNDSVVQSKEYSHGFCGIVDVENADL